MPYTDGTTRVADLFRMRNAQRLGLSPSEQDRARDAELTSFGESLGVLSRGGAGAMPSAPAGAPAMPEPPAPPMPAGPTNGLMAGGGGGAPPMPGQPVEEGPPATPAGDTMSSQAPAPHSAMSGARKPLTAPAGGPYRYNRQIGRVVRAQ